MRNILKISFLLLAYFTIGCNGSSNDGPDHRAYEILLQTFENEDGWKSLCSAEFLIDLGYKIPIKEHYLNQLINYENTLQYRIDIWRVLAMSSTLEEEKNKWIDKIISVYQDTNQIDKLYAAGSLIKLDVNLVRVAPDQPDRESSNGDITLKSHIFWSGLVSENSDSINLNILYPLLLSQNAIEKR